MRCFMSIAGPIKTKDGTFIKIKPYNCSISLECALHLSKVLMKEETERMTEKGLLTDADPLGPDKMLKYLTSKCNHPQKHQIMKHITSLEPYGILIPHDVLRLIDRFGLEGKTQ